MVESTKIENAFFTYKTAVKKGNVKTNSDKLMNSDTLLNIDLNQPSLGIPIKLGQSFEIVGLSNNRI